ncbi:hypothetical protein SC206_18700 [Rouxiella sp. T17]|uniref:hypothetical protein n=1 Tax=Rouxiella sp. T17 TaxID=3085684 RepID=UPI002FC6C9F5
MKKNLNQQKLTSFLQTTPRAGELNRYCKERIASGEISGDDLILYLDDIVNNIPLPETVQADVYNALDALAGLCHPSSYVGEGNYGYIHHA